MATFEEEFGRLETEWRERQQRKRDKNLKRERLRGEALDAIAGFLRVLQERGSPNTLTLATRSDDEASSEGYGARTVLETHRGWIVGGIWSSPELLSFDERELLGFQAILADGRAVETGLLEHDPGSNTDVDADAVIPDAFIERFVEVETFIPADYRYIESGFAEHLAYLAFRYVHRPSIPEASGHQTSAEWWNELSVPSIVIGDGDPDEAYW